jgi:hypothetical protein
MQLYYVLSSERTGGFHPNKHSVVKRLPGRIFYQSPIETVAFNLIPAKRLIIAKSAQDLLSYWPGFFSGNPDHTQGGGNLCPGRDGGDGVFVEITHQTTRPSAVSPLSLAYRHTKLWQLWIWPP